jgi:hypothetical protein
MSNAIFEIEYLLSCKFIITIILNVSLSAGKKFKMSKNIEKQDVKNYLKKCV